MYLTKNKEQPKWAKKLAREGWVPRVGGYRHMATGVSVIRAVTFEDADAEPMWRVIDKFGTMLEHFPSLTEATAFAETTVLLMEE